MNRSDAFNNITFTQGIKRNKFKYGNQNFVGGIFLFFNLMLLKKDSISLLS